MSWMHENTTPMALLSPERAAELSAAPHGLDVYLFGPAEWINNCGMSITASSVYRARREPPIVLHPQLAGDFDPCGAAKALMKAGDHRATAARCIRAEATVTDLAAMLAREIEAREAVDAENRSLRDQLARVLAPKREVA